jgi:hypothetical protein
MAIAEGDKWIASRLSHSQGKLLSIRGGSHEEIVTPNHFVELISSGRNLCIG